MIPPLVTRLGAALARNMHLDTLDNCCNDTEMEETIERWRQASLDFMRVARQALDTLEGK